MAKISKSAANLGVSLVTALLEGEYLDGLHQADACSVCVHAYRDVANQFARNILGEKLAPKENSRRLQIKSGNEFGSVYLVATREDGTAFDDFLKRDQPLLPEYRHVSIVPWARYGA